MTELDEDYLFPPEQFEIIDVMSDQKTIYEKWDEGEISILPDSYEQELELIKKALTEVVTRRVEKIESLPDVPFTPSEAHMQKMQEIIEASKKHK